MDKNKDIKDTLDFIINFVGKNPSENIESDAELLKKDDYKHIRQHNEAYTKILDAYGHYVDSMLIFKRRYRWLIIIFFLLVLIMFAVVGNRFVLKLMEAEEFRWEDLVALISVLATILSALLIVPIKITEYIFDKDEQKHIVDIIKNIQDYDKNTRSHLDFKNNRDDILK